MRLFLLLPLLGLTACLQKPDLSRVDPVGAPFPVLRFFEGRTEGEGLLRTVLREPAQVRVRSFGRRVDDGTLYVSQRIDQQGRPPRTREWRIREVAPGRYKGTLSDADGPVTGEMQGNTLLLRFPMDGFRVEQRLVLLPGGHAAHNVLTVGRFGFTVATLDETIRKLD